MKDHAEFFEHRSFFQKLVEHRAGLHNLSQQMMKIVYQTAEQRMFFQPVAHLLKVMAFKKRYPSKTSAHLQ